MAIALLAPIPTPMIGTGTYAIDSSLFMIVAAGGRNCCTLWRPNL